MAAENIDNTVNGTGLFNAKIPGLGDAADIQAGAAQGVAALDHGDFQSQLRRTDGANIAAGAGTDHDHIKLCHGLSL